jgi:Cys-rich protein (TIGR01571 family)
MSRPLAKKKSTAPLKWFSGLCDFCNDPTLCCSVCLCQYNAMGQMYQRSTRRPNACMLISLFAWFIFITTTILSQTSNVLTNTAVTQTEIVCTEWWNCTIEHQWDQITTASIIGGVSGTIAFVGTIFGTYVICTSRRIVRDRDKIPEGTCGGCDDCCVSYWCGCCALIQLFKQERVSGGEYRPCATLGV